MIAQESTRRKCGYERAYLKNKHSDWSILEAFKVRDMPEAVGFSQPRGLPLTANAPKNVAFLHKKILFSVTDSRNHAQ